MWKFAKKRPRAGAGPKAIKHLTVCRQPSSPGGSVSVCTLLCRKHKAKSNVGLADKSGRLLATALTSRWRQEQNH